MERVYLDHAATTPLDPRVLEAMMPYLTRLLGQPLQPLRRGPGGPPRPRRRPPHDRRDPRLPAAGRRRHLRRQRGRQPRAASAPPTPPARQGRGDHVITTAIEHHAVLHAAERLEQEGFRVTYLGVDREGFIDLAELEDAVTDETVLVSIMYVNNEVGTIEPIEEAVRVVKAKNPRAAFHTDAVQAAGALDINVDRLGVDLLSIAAHKFYGPKGVGALYVRPRTAVQWQQLGGSQEKNRRAGTENVAGVVGMAKALELAYEELDARNAHVRALRDRLITGVPERVPGVHLTGPNVILRHEGSGAEVPASRSSERPDPLALRYRRASGGTDVPARQTAEPPTTPPSASRASKASPSSSPSTSPASPPPAAAPAPAARWSPPTSSPPWASPRTSPAARMRLTVGKDNTMAQMDYVLDVLPDIVSRIRGSRRRRRSGANLASMMDQNFHQTRPESARDSSVRRAAEGAVRAMRKPRVVVHFPNWL